eukprot:8902642-Pyramimonas_sp.AAC.1
MHDDNRPRYVFFTSCPSKVVKKIVEKFEISKTRTARPQGKLTALVMYTPERYPMVMDDELVITDHSNCELDLSETKSTESI